MMTASPGCRPRMQCSSLPCARGGPPRRGSTPRSLSARWPYAASAKRRFRRTCAQCTAARAPAAVRRGPLLRRRGGAAAGGLQPRGLQPTSAANVRRDKDREIRQSRVFSDDQRVTRTEQRSSAAGPRGGLYTSTATSWYGGRSAQGVGNWCYRYWPLLLLP
jgi:hypothetical protein